MTAIPAVYWALIVENSCISKTIKNKDEASLVKLIFETVYRTVQLLVYTNKMMRFGFFGGFVNQVSYLSLFPKAEEFSHVLAMTKIQWQNTRETW